jgi:hypothetical protein
MSLCIISIPLPGWGTRCRSWLRHYATSRKVAGSIPDELIGFFNWPNPSSSTMALGSTQPLTEMSTRNLPGCKGRPARDADNLTAICGPRSLTTIWAFTACYRNSFTLPRKLVWRCRFWIVFWALPVWILFGLSTILIEIMLSQHPVARLYIHSVFRLF